MKQPGSNMDDAYEDDSAAEVQTTRAKAIVAVHNTFAGGAAFKQVLQMLLRIEVKTFQVGPDDTIAELLPKLNELCSDTDRLYINGGLVFRECRQTRSHLGGLEFLLHLRLTPGLLPLSRLHAVLGVLEDPAELIRRTPDNCLIFAPGTGHLHPLRLIRGIRSLISGSSNEADSQQGTRSFIHLTDFDEQRKSHGLLNRVGIGKLILECAADVAGTDHPLLGQFQQLLASDLWAKKMLALRPDVLTPMPATQEALSSVRKRFSALKGRPVAIYIDDEHVHGWSSGLYMTLTGQNCSATQFLHSGITKSPCERLSCIDNCDDASKLFEDKQSEFKSLLQAWTDAEHNAMLANVAAAKANMESEDLRQKLKQAIAERQKAEQALVSAKTKAADEQGKCIKQMDRFKELALEVAVAEDAPGLGLLDSVPELRTLIPVFKESIEGYEKADRSAAQAGQSFAKHCAKHDSLRAETENTDAASMATEQELARALKQKADLEKEVYSAYPCSLVFLDLRLKPQEDESCSIEKTTGMQLLRKIKQAFPCLPIVMMTASQQAVSSETARSVGAGGYWIKGLHSGEYLTELLDTVIDQAELREFWVKLRMLQSKRHWWCIKYDAKSDSPVPRVLFQPEDRFDIQQRIKSLPNCPANLEERLNEDIADRRFIQEKLEEALMLLFQFGAGNRSEALCRRDYPFDQIVLNMGQIQELRFLGVRERRWDDAYEMLGSENLAKLERELRKLRNEIAHSGVPFSSREDARRHALKFLAHTFNSLLLSQKLNPKDINPLFLKETGVS